MTRIKICGLTRAEDVALAVELGADAVGFVAHPQSPRCLTADQIRTLAAQVPPFVTTVTVFGPFPDRFELSTDLVQGFGRPLSPQWIQSWRPEPGAKPPNDPGRALLLDALTAEGGGGTGHRVDWELAAEIVHAAPYPVILAGGLNAHNVQEAIREVAPFAVDVASGIESAPGIKDPAKLRAFIEAVRAS